MSFVSLVATVPAPSSSSRSAAPGSAAVMNRSPIRNARYPSAREPRDVGRRLQPALADGDHSRGHARDELLGDVDIDRERAQVAIVDADDGRRRRRRATASSSRCAPRRARRGRGRRPSPSSRVSSAGRSAADDQQDRIGARGPRLEQLILRDDEVLPEQRNVDRLPHRARDRRATRRRTSARSGPRSPPRPPPRIRAQSPPGRSRRAARRATAIGACTRR